MIVKFDHGEEKVRVNLKAKQLLEIDMEMGKNIIANWMPEACEYMIEGTPAVPYGRHNELKTDGENVDSLSHLLDVEINMSERYHNLIYIINYNL